jgi:hypothetical protein
LTCNPARPVPRPGAGFVPWETRRHLALRGTARFQAEALEARDVADTSAPPVGATGCPAQGIGRPDARQRRDRMVQACTARVAIPLPRTTPRP